MKHRKLFWLAANLLMLSVIIAVVWATLLPAIWGPNEDVQSPFGDRRARQRDR